MYSRTFNRQDIHKLRGTAASEEDLKAQVDFLGFLVIELLREVEILRKTQIDESEQKGISPKHSLYGKNYREIGLLTNNSAGPSDGVTKLARFWVPEPTLDPFVLSELPMLRRLGYTPEEIKDYLEEVDEVSTYS